MSKSIKINNTTYVIFMNNNIQSIKFTKYPRSF